MKDILSHVSINDLVFALKTADSYIQNKFYINLTESRLQELKEHMEFCGPVAVADVKQARDKIVMYAFKLDEMGPYLAFRAMRGKSFINKLM